MKLEIINKTRKRIRKTFIQKVVKKTFVISRRRMKSFSLSVVFTGRKEIQSMNRAYCKKNRSTDILSFNYSSGYNKRRGKDVIEGELIVCPEIVAKSAKKNGVIFQKELAFVVSHGILHLLGMRHGKGMYEIQDKVCKILNPKF